MLKREIHRQETPKSLTWGVLFSLQSRLAFFFFSFSQILTSWNRTVLLRIFMRLPNLVLHSSPMPAYVCMQVYLDHVCSGADVSVWYPEVWGQALVSSSRMPATYLLWDRFSRWPGVHHCARLVGPELGASLPYLSPQLPHPTFLWRFWGLNTKTSCLQSTYFTNWAIPPAFRSAFLL